MRHAMSKDMESNQRQISDDGSFLLTLTSTSSSFLHLLSIHRTIQCSHRLFLVPFFFYNVKKIIVVIVEKEVDE